MSGFVSYVEVIPNKIHVLIWLHNFNNKKKQQYLQE